METEDPPHLAVLMPREPRTFLGAPLALPFQGSVCAGGRGSLRIRGFHRRKSQPLTLSDSVIFLLRERKTFVVLLGLPETNWAGFPGLVLSGRRGGRT